MVNSATSCLNEMRCPRPHPAGMQCHTEAGWGRHSIGPAKNGHPVATLPGNGLPALDQLTMYVQCINICHLLAFETWVYSSIHVGESESRFQHPNTLNRVSARGPNLAEGCPWVSFKAHGASTQPPHRARMRAGGRAVVVGPHVVEARLHGEHARTLRVCKHPERSLNGAPWNLRDQASHHDPKNERAAEKTRTFPREQGSKGGLDG